MAWYHRFLNTARPDRLSRELDRELEFHLAERVDELMAGGMSEAEARREARIRFGGAGVQKERARDRDVLPWLESLVADVRYALRSLRSNPGFALVAVLSLGLGIGANTAIFSLIDAVMLRSLPVSRPEELVQVNMGERGDVDFTNPLWEELRDRQDVFSGAFAYSDQRFDLAGGGEVRPVAGAWVSGGFFGTLGVAPAAGRLLTAGGRLPGLPGRGGAGPRLLAERVRRRPERRGAERLAERASLPDRRRGRGPGSPGWRWGGPCRCSRRSAPRRWSMAGTAGWTSAAPGSCASWAGARRG